MLFRDITCKINLKSTTGLKVTGNNYNSGNSQKVVQYYVQQQCTSVRALTVSAQQWSKRKKVRNSYGITGVK